MAESRGQRAKRIFRYVVRIFVPVTAVMALGDVGVGMAAGASWGVFLFGMGVVGLIGFAASYFCLLYLGLGSSAHALGGSMRTIEAVLQEDYKQSTGSSIVAGTKAAWRLMRVVGGVCLVMALLPLLQGDWEMSKALLFGLGIALVTISVIIGVYVVTSALVNRVLGDEPAIDP